jgi:hypothetical protein
MPRGREFDNEEKYIWSMWHRHRSMQRSAPGRAAHVDQEILNAGFLPTRVRLREAGRNFEPESVVTVRGQAHLFERKTSGYYSKSAQNNIYLATVYAGRHGLPITIELQNNARMSRNLERLVRKVQRRFGGEIVRTTF